jgi:hypothetical protein
MFELRHELFCFLNGENHSLADSFSNKDFLLKMSHLTDIFEKLNILNTSLQRNEATVLSWNDKVKLWRNSMESDTLDMFPTLVSTLQGADNPVLPMDIKSCLLDCGMSIYEETTTFRTDVQIFIVDVQNIQTSLDLKN